MADIGKVTPGKHIISRVPREAPAKEKREHPQPDEEQEEEEAVDEEEENGNDDDEEQEGGIDLYV